MTEQFWQGEEQGTSLSVPLLGLSKPVWSKVEKSKVNVYGNFFCRGPMFTLRQTRQSVALRLLTTCYNVN